jgi:hypothetical protein
MEDIDNKKPDDEAVPTGPHRRDDLQKGDVLAIDTTREITIAEHETKFWVAIRQWPTAVFWAMFFCIAVIMAGFDAQLVTSFYALPAFQQRFGYEYQGAWIISAPWQLGLGMVGPLPSIAGASTDQTRVTLSDKSSAHSVAVGPWRNSVDD